MQTMDELKEFNLYENLPVGMAVFLYDFKGYHALFTNQVLVEEMGVSGEEIAEAFQGDLTAIVHPDDAEDMRIMLYKGSVTGGRFGKTGRIRLKDGSYSWMDIRVNAVLDAGGTCRYYFILTDVNSQRENELRLERTYERLLGIMNNTPGGIIVFDARDNRIPVPSFISPGMYRLIEGTPEEAARRFQGRYNEIVHPDDLEQVIRAMEDAMRNLSPFQLTVRLLTLKGDYIWVDINGSVGNFQGRRSLCMSYANTSADRKAQQLLRKVLDLFVRRQYDNIAVIDCRDRTYHILSDNYQTKSGKVPEGGMDYDVAIGAVIKHFITEDEQERIRAALELDHLVTQLQTQDEVEIYTTVRMPNGKLRYKKMWLSWIDEPNGQMAFVIDDYTELRKQEMERQQTLADALKAAEQANVAKSEFLSRMSHDIRTPLNAIMGFTQISLADGQVGPETHERLEKIQSASGFLLSLINDVLDMSRIESGKTVLKKEVFTVQSLLAGVHSIIYSQCEEKALDYQCRVDGSLQPAYRGDRLKLQQVLVNLLGNAVKFTPRGGSVSLAVSEREVTDRHAVVCFEVADTGIGISEAFLPQLFEVFTQEGDGKTAQPGTGLGLAICKNIVAMMHGSLKVRSKKGEGSVFTAEVQLERAGEREDDLSSPAEKKTAPTEPLEKDAFKGRRALLAEDHPMNQEIAVHLLKKIGLQVDVAENGKIACDKYAVSPEGYYDVIILDIRMPVMDGLEAATVMRGSGREDSAAVPIIAMSADAFDEDISKSLESGFDAHLIKPVNPDLLYQTLARFFHRGEGKDPAES